MKQKLLISFLLLSTILYSQVSIVETLFGPNNQLNLPPGGLNSTNSLTPLGNHVYFKARKEPSQYRGMELYRSNGQSINLVRDINNSPTNFSSNPKNFFTRTFTNDVFFVADDAQTPSDFELWKTDGTGIGTVKVHDFNANGSSNPRRFVEYNNELFFAVTGANTGEELGYSDGTSTGSGIIEINTGTNGSEPQGFKVFNGELYFSAATASGRELWKTNGTQSGTVLVKDINTTGDSNPEKLTVYNNKLYFAADDGINGNELWETDGTTTGTQLVSDLNPGQNGSNPQQLTPYKGRLYLSANTVTTGREIYRVGMGGGISLFRDIVQGSTGCNAEKFFHYTAQDLLLFVAGNGNINKELWYTNGSLVFTNQLKDINPGTTGSDINKFNNANFVEYNGKVYFVANDGSSGSELWVTDGTTNGTTLVANVASGGLSATPGPLTVVNDLLLFKATDGFNGYELWKYADPALSNNEFDILDANIYPNPVSTSFSLKNTGTIDRLDIYDIQGKLVKSFDTEMQAYNIEELKSNIYFLKLFSDNKEMTLKLLKE